MSSLKRHWRMGAIVLTLLLAALALMSPADASAKRDWSHGHRATSTTTAPAPAPTAPATTAASTSTAATSATRTTATTTAAPTTTAPSTTSASTTTAATPQSRQVDWGMHVAGDLSGGWSEINSVESLVGRKATIIHGFMAWDAGSFDAAGAAQVASHGATPMLTWEPWASPYNVNDSAYSLASIINGSHDAYIRQFAAQIAAYGSPVLLRFAHEMNGNWYPWSEQVNGNQPGQYVAAWRHVHDLVVQAGATNAIWVWSPNVDDGGGWATPMSELYPGDAYVDRVALDGYNWGNTQSGSTWQSFATIFDPSIQQMTAIAPSKPLIIAETASTESGGNKAQWITDMFSSIAQTPQISALVWFNENKETDWRIQSSSASATAFHQGITGSLFRGQPIS